MIPLIASVTIRQIARQRRMLLLVLLALVPVLVALTYRLAVDRPAEEATEFAVGILATFTVALVLPLTALLFGTSAIGQDIEEGTVVYLLSKPLARWKVIAAKIGAASLLTAVVVGLSVVATGAVVLLGGDDVGLIPAFVVAVVLGALAYSALFVALSLRFSRALVIGLAYVFVWEAIVSQFITGVRFLSVSAYTVAIADGLSNVPADVVGARLGVQPAIVLLAILVAVTSWYSIRLLVRYQISERV